MPETAALLPGADDDSDDTDNATTMPHHPRRRLSPGARPKPLPPLPASSPHSPRRAVRPLLLLVALVNLAWSLYQLPVSRIVESRLCREYYAVHDPSVLRPEDGSVPEERCKIERVQQPLGWMLGMVEAGWVAGDFIMTIPLVCLADHFGHRFVLCLNLIPRVFLLAWSFAVGYFDRVLPVKAILAAPMLSFLGGDCVFNSLVYALVSDLTEDHVLRATLFGYVNAISSIFSLQLGPALASATMSVLLWLPPLLGIGLLALAVPVTSVVPLPRGGVVPVSFPPAASGQSYGADAEEDIHTHSDIEALADQHLLPNPTTTTPRKPTLKTHTLHRLRTLLTLLRNPSRQLALLLTVFFLASFASSDTKLLPLYISTRYAGWRLADVGYLLSVKAVFNFGLLWVGVPGLLRWRRGRRVLPFWFRLGSASRVGEAGRAIGGSGRDGGDNRGDGEAEGETVENAVICLGFSVLGAVLIGISPTVWVLLPSLLVYALGIALPMFTYSLLKAPSMGLAGRVRGGDSGEGTGGNGGNGDEEGDMGTQLFSVVMLVRTVGTLVGTVVMPALWVTGLGVGGWALGLPFLVSAGGYAVAVLVVRRIDV